MNYWLIKSEPNVYSWDTFVKDKKVVWDGVRNYAARNNLKAMKRGDLALFYHSNIGLNIVGVAEVTKASFQDPTTLEEAWVAVEFKPHSVFKKPIGLNEIKSHPLLKSMKLVKISRLSVSDVAPEEYTIICELAQCTRLKK
ncbi:MAG: EVE domain-containing protein [Sphingobacteriaceae bacterium]|nr:EVE domain-containing protein [Sphingobacteriaceae bacterium]